jgi:hypothetical protein
MNNGCVFKLCQRRQLYFSSTDASVWNGRFPAQVCRLDLQIGGINNQYYTLICTNSLFYILTSTRRIIFLLHTQWFHQNLLKCSLHTHPFHKAQLFPIYNQRYNYQLIFKSVTVFYKLHAVHRYIHTYIHMFIRSSNFIQNYC